MWEGCKEAMRVWAAGMLAAQAGFRAPSAQSLCSGYLGLSHARAAPVTGNVLGVRQGDDCKRRPG